MKSFYLYIIYMIESIEKFFIRQKNLGTKLDVRKRYFNIMIQSLALVWFFHMHN